MSNQPPHASLQDDLPDCDGDDPLALAIRLFPAHTTGAGLSPAALGIGRVAEPPRREQEPLANSTYGVRGAGPDPWGLRLSRSVLGGLDGFDVDTFFADDALDGGGEATEGDSPPAHVTAAARGSLANDDASPLPAAMPAVALEAYDACSAPVPAACGGAPPVLVANNITPPATCLGARGALYAVSKRRRTHAPPPLAAESMTPRDLHPNAGLVVGASSGPSSRRSSSSTTTPSQSQIDFPFHVLPAVAPPPAMPDGGNGGNNRSSALPVALAPPLGSTGGAVRRRRPVPRPRNREVQRTCSHCQSSKTPQWREGPDGRRTLCNACGLRYKSHRLVPEYRAAESMTPRDLHPNAGLVGTSSGPSSRPSSSSTTTPSQSQIDFPSHALPAVAPPAMPDGGNGGNNRSAALPVALAPPSAGSTGGAVRRRRPVPRPRNRQVQRTCSHCQSSETPQWREGPDGRRTLCNACGLRYRSHRLVPEYRPTTSSSFQIGQHSNRHRRIIEIREQNGTAGS
ncbi:GATA transcription factor 11 [Zea mays]|uniref:GATA transcription factor 11 n=1 Tax=Zea mays TaxID=4577 RepID=A0A3L6EYW9_MAIZE|nr:GATA transcription factor 11 [Zea mays]